ncbi:divergent polysaccharide deacetylase family protein [Zavarzinia compransoris]|uniref:Divergent polysaccharide deacetylase family protein n=1 Tax=Zavarzinia compransoris TaxID=1264899 RepID=A0A317EA66_9PROT|nr:divergent polysaccharide deacetylase family protein [Zavarzinia compransoris]PWR23819.1 hypothetical protein DKG75_04465 [Zavarzinia compransoris]TDP48052.1 hypothetical protein DES42_102349 [Zavarzinia compransoris]
MPEKGRGTRAVARRPRSKPRGTRARRGGVLGRPLVRRAVIALWAVVVAAAVGFLLMRTMDEQGFALRRPTAVQPGVVAAAPPPAPVTAAPAAPAAQGRLGIATPVEKPEVAQALPPPPAVAAEEAPYDSRPAWQRYAQAPGEAPGKKPLLAIVIDDVGVARRDLDALLDLDPGVTFAIMGYAERMDDFARKARARGHELMIHVPMEPQGNADPGPNALKLGLGADEIRRRLRWHLDRHDSYVGINNHMGSRFTADAAAMAVVAEELRARGLLFLDSKTIGNSAGEDRARAAGIPTASRDVFLDNEIGANAIEAQLVLAERRAREKGTAIAIGHPHAATVEALARFLPQAKARGIAIVPVSTVIFRRAGSAAAAGGGDATPASGATDGSGKRNGSPPRPRG